MRRERPLSRLRRRALAPISRTEMEPASSTQMGEEEMVPRASVMRRQSSRERWPVRNLWASIWATEATRRWRSDSLDISRLKTATGWPERMAMFSARLRASAVFPCEAREIVADDVLYREEADADAVFGELEDGRFGVVEDGVGAVFALEGALLDIVRGMNEIAEDGFFFDDARVVLDVGDAGHAVGEGGEIGRAASGFEVAAAVELFGEGDEVDGLLALAEGDHLSEDAAVLIEEEIFGLEIFDGGVEGVVVEDYGAEDGTLGVEVVGERLFESGFGGHGLFLFRFSFAYDNTSLFVDARAPENFQVARIILGSTDSLFAAE